MLENIRMIKSWYNVSRPTTSTFIWQFITYFVHAICMVIAPIYAAKVVSNLSWGNFNAAIIYLSVVFAFLVIRNIAMIINYKNSNKLYDEIYMPLQKIIVSKVVNAKDKNFSNTNKEKLLNIYHTASYNMATYGKTLACGTSKLLRLIITLFVVVFINPIVAALLVLIDFTNFFILNHLYKKIASYNKEINEERDSQNVAFCDIYDSKEILNEMKLRKRAEGEFLSISKKLSNTYGKRTLCQSHIDNSFFVYYNTIVFVITLVLIILVSKNSLSLEQYLIIVPYLTTGITDANEFFTMFVDLKNVNVHTNRLKTVLSFSEKDFLEFGKNTTDEIMGTLDLNNVTCPQQKVGNTKLPALNNISFHIHDNEATLIMGPRGCGKRTIFYLLRRIISPKQGNVLLSGVKINEYSEKVYNSNITYCTTKPFFFRGSIMKNFKMVESNRNKILNMCKRLEILDDIEALPKGFGANPKSASLELQYLIGLCRSLLTQSEIAVLYEFPNTLTDAQKTRILSILNTLKKSRTLIIFSATEYCSKIADKIIYLDDGEIKNIAFNQTT